VAGGICAAGGFPCLHHPGALTYTATPLTRRSGSRLAEEEGRRQLPPPRRPCRLWPWPFAAMEPGRLYLNGTPGICTSFFWIFMRI
jgi:hypothetical protein